MRNSFPPAATTRRPSERGPATSKTCGIGSANGQTIGPDATPMTIDIAAISKITCSPDETPILAHHQGLQLPHRVEGDADHATASRPPVRKLLAKLQPISQKHHMHSRLLRIGVTSEAHVVTQSVFVYR